MSATNFSEISIDGSTLEGGGQILRIATALAGICRRPVRVFNIRAARPKPGLAAQHLTGLVLARDIIGGQLIGDEMGSTEIRFKPGKSVVEREQFIAYTRTAG